MASVTHELKIAPIYYDAILSGDKTFEIRFNDREYQKGDALKLRAYRASSGQYDSTRPDVILCDVTYVTSYQQKPGWVVLGIKVL